MYIYSLTQEDLLYDNPVDSKWYKNDQEYFIVCAAQEILELYPIFHFDKETIEECMNIDENIRFDSFDNYDFISLNHLILEKNDLFLEEINLYVGQNYVILVGKQYSQIIKNITQHIFQKLKMLTEKTGQLNKIYFWTFDQLLTNFFTTLEQLEDKIEAIESHIIKNVRNEHFIQINHLREQINKAKKHLRPLLYIGDQFIINENKFIQVDNLRYFKNIDIRINKLYDFVLNLKEMSDQLLYLYDSSLTTQTNAIANRLTVLAIFFGPLTVITGIYGMNFKHMPELNWALGYPLTLSIMVLLTIILYVLFKKKKWL